MDAHPSLSPILHRLSGDTSFLLQFPNPLRYKEFSTGRIYYNVLIDPWLSESQTDFNRLLSRQWHREKPAIGSIAEVVELIKKGEENNGEDHNQSWSKDGLNTIDAVFILHEFTDHCHQRTLIQLHPDVLICATPGAAKIIDSWGHFRRIVVIQDLPAKNAHLPINHKSMPHLPYWLSVTRLSAGDALYLHSALLITYLRPKEDKEIQSEQLNERTTGIIYTPHGIPASALVPLQTVYPHVNPICLIHGLTRVKVGPIKINLGVSNGLQLQRELRAKYWVRCHDEKKYRSGVVAYLQKDYDGTVADAIDEDLRSKLDRKDAGYVEVGNGERLILSCDGRHYKGYLD